ncbi:MAG: ROK family protein, partial [Bacteroidales bacterium]|nr:ROK family protein [Bacteroidales bacterium]
VFIENDANAAAYGEFVAGAAKGAKNAVCITLGTGGAAHLSGQPDGVEPDEHARAGQQGHRGPQRLRALVRHPPGRRAQGGQHLRDHQSQGYRPGRQQHRADGPQRPRRPALPPGDPGHQAVRREAGRLLPGIPQTGGQEEAGDRRRPAGAGRRRARRGGAHQAGLPSGDERQGPAARREHRPGHRRREIRRRGPRQRPGGRRHQRPQVHHQAHDDDQGIHDPEHHQGFRRRGQGPHAGGARRPCVLRFRRQYRHRDRVRGGLH